VVVIGVASTAPAYSLAATLGFIVARGRPAVPVIVILAFVRCSSRQSATRAEHKARPDLRDDIHLGHSGVRTEYRLVGGVGDHRG
jgi:hypothetical protein